MTVPDFWLSPLSLTLMNLNQLRTFILITEGNSLSGY